MRCNSLVLLAVLLVSRYLFSFALFEPQNTLHVVVLDDSLSMSDQWKEDGLDQDCFQVGGCSADVRPWSARLRCAANGVSLTTQERSCQREVPRGAAGTIEWIRA